MLVNIMLEIKTVLFKVSVNNFSFVLFLFFYVLICLSQSMIYFLLDYFSLCFVEGFPGEGDKLEGGKCLRNMSIQTSKQIYKHVEEKKEREKKKRKGFRDR